MAKKIPKHRPRFGPDASAGTPVISLKAVRRRKRYQGLIALGPMELSLAVPGLVIIVAAFTGTLSSSAWSRPLAVLAVFGLLGIAPLRTLWAYHKKWGPSNPPHGPGKRVG
jgi:hypothetical protein